MMNLLLITHLLVNIIINNQPIYLNEIFPKKTINLHNSFSKFN